MNGDTAPPNRFSQRPIAYLALAALIGLALILALVESALHFTSWRMYIDRHTHAPIPQYYIQSDPALGFDLAPNVKAARFYSAFREFDHEVFTNKYGCFDRTTGDEGDYSLLLGDSLIWGWTPYQQTMGAQLERRLGSPVMKCGVMGYGVERALAKGRKVVAQRGRMPKIVIFGFSWNDLNDDHFPGYSVVDGILANGYAANYVTGEYSLIDNEALPKFLANEKKYGLRQEAPPGLIKGLPLALKKFAKNNSILYNLSKYGYKIPSYYAGMYSNHHLPRSSMNRYLRYLAYLDETKYPWIENAWRKTFENISAMNDWAEGMDAKFILVIIPTKEQIYFQKQVFRSAEAMERPRKRLMEFLESRHIKYVDILPGFRKAVAEPGTPMLYYKHNTHWNEAGSGRAAQIVHKAIESELNRK
ncbi:MAG: hypothetical protein OEZ55_09960 [Nitrospinota bacterium]|nr:hypothetical protein [Nitrospinota bacterium]